MYESKASFTWLSIPYSTRSHLFTRRRNLSSSSKATSIFPSTEPVKHVNNGGRIEMGASPDDKGAGGRLFKGSIVSTGISSEGLALFLVKAGREEGPDWFEVGELDCFLFLDNLSSSFVSFSFISFFKLSTRSLISSERESPKFLLRKFTQ